jgi:MFS transporter, putative metabolite:H+ symporter
MENLNPKRLFYGSCFALITTAFSFSIRAGILPQLADTFQLTATQLGFINSMFFFGFPISMVLGGIFYTALGPKRIMMFAFVAHTLGILLTIYSGGYTGLLISTLFIGLGNGCTEAACNPMIATMYTGKTMNTLLNRFHMWFPGGIVLGSLISEFMTQRDLGWQAQIWVIMIPTLIYAYMFFGQAFPVSKKEVASLVGNLTAMATPLFIFMCVCMTLTAISEFGPTQWAQLFAIGVCYFWPNMIGFVAEKIPASGAIGMSIVGAFGMFSTAMFQPIIGNWIDQAKEKAASMNLDGDALELAAGQATLQKMMIFPIILIVLFTILLFWVRSRKIQAAAVH